MDFTFNKGNISKALLKMWAVYLDSFSLSLLNIIYYTSSHTWNDTSLSIKQIKQVSVYKDHTHTATDIIEIASADLFIYIGGISDSWVEKTLKSANSENLKAVALMDMVQTYDVDF